MLPAENIHKMYTVYFQGRLVSIKYTVYSLHWKFVPQASAMFLYQILASATRRDACP